ncbi:unsaturated chondroitin disaccharide hydrolase [Jejuia pallidilutea]|uniref:Unsaturated chondroitin disaccharide hydrolase n=1 Tax=Jejuia pallidilutea TaxID=504487 RepID=A0A362X0B7_9FLAO|nr:glycoside hydrolase family 88 protein [Jejuia pallidilutea]PQV48956.1 unsaturated chondroitin disaccharide hydrolase [Jejuia pallidilutea]
MSIVKPSLIAALFLMLACNSTKKEVSADKISGLQTSKVLQSNVVKLKEVVKTLSDADSFPRNIKKDKTDWDFVGVEDWCSGFWPGVLWYAYEASNDPEMKAEAMRFTAPLKTIAYSSARNHDIGFMVYCSYGNGYRLTGNEAYKDVLLSAADTLATLYSPKVGTILSWPSQMHKFKYNTIIDNMMNLELLFWAAKNGGDTSLHDIAVSHAQQTMEHIVRKDSAVYHVGSFDEDTGEFLKGYTHQGYADESMWARGQGWGVYGFAVAYRETGDKAFLETSKKLADHFLNRLPKDGIPYWDFDDPNIPEAPKDASAAAVVACGLFELVNLVEDKELKAKYFKAAKDLVSTLSSSEYLSGDKNQALLLHSTGHYPKNSEIDVPIVYADYYYMEALLRLKNLEKLNSETDKVVAN